MSAMIMTFFLCFSVVHWLFMTLWVVWQDTDFCKNVWEERLYNAIVGVIYCFCFFNLKEGKSRYRASIFYSIMTFENLAFLGVYYWMEQPVIFQEDGTLPYWLVTSSFAIVIASMFVGLASMMVYYRFFHPAGPIRPCYGDSVDFQQDLEELKKAGKLSPQQQVASSSPDFVVYDNHTIPRQRPVSYSRSFKKPCPPSNRSREVSQASQQSPEAELAQQMAAISPISTRNFRERAIDCGNMSPVLDSAYGTDSNRTGSPPNNQQQRANNSSSTNSSAFNNETYMNADEAAKVINKSDDNTYMSVNIQDKQDNMVLKRSPVVRDVTSGFAQISSTTQLMKRKMTILLPTSLEKTISLEALNPTNVTHVSNHDYENMALININRAGTSLAHKVSHWRTYSNMADSKHDESCAYERQNYYDIYPLSKEMKEQLYRSLTPLSTAATMASDSVASNDTYEPIENYESMATVTLIHHDGDKLSTQQITTMESLKEVLHKHDKVPMDDPQDRPDLYILAPMRLLSPIMEESSEVATNQDLNKSLMTVISEILMNNSNYATMQTMQAQPQVADGKYPDGRFPDSVESTSSTLVHTIDEIRNNSLCNLYYTTANELKKPAKSVNKAAPQVPPRNEDNKVSRKPVEKVIVEEEPESPQYREIQERRRKSALYTSVGSRKNLLELAGTTNHILNTPQKTITEPVLSILDPSKLPGASQDFDCSKIRPFENSHSLSPSAKYDTPTPPLKSNQFVRNTNAYRPRRKFSMIREKFQDQPRPKPMIVAKNKTDLYENISNDFLNLRSNSMRAKAERMAKCKSVPSISNHLIIQADEQYQDGFMKRRNQWSTASYQKPVMSDLRRSEARRSMSILDKENFPIFDKENIKPLPPKPKIKSVEAMRGSPKAYRLSSGASLSPRSKIFSSAASNRLH